MNKISSRAWQRGASRFTTRGGTIKDRAGLTRYINTYKKGMLQKPKIDFIPSNLNKGYNNREARGWADLALSLIFEKFGKVLNPFFDIDMLFSDIVRAASKEKTLITPAFLKKYLLTADLPKRNLKYIENIKSIDLQELANAFLQSFYNRLNLLNLKKKRFAVNDSKKYRTIEQVRDIKSRSFNPLVFNRFAPILQKPKNLSRLLNLATQNNLSHYINSSKGGVIPSMPFQPSRNAYAGIDVVKFLNDYLNGHNLFVTGHPLLGLMYLKDYRNAKNGFIQLDVSRNVLKGLPILYSPHFALADRSARLNALKKEPIERQLSNNNDISKSPFYLAIISPVSNTPEGAFKLLLSMNPVIYKYKRGNLIGPYKVKGFRLNKRVDRKASYSLWDKIRKSLYEKGSLKEKQLVTISNFKNKLEILK